MFKVNPDLQIMTKFFNLGELVTLERTLPKINFTQVIHVKKNQPIITLDNIDSLPNFENWQEQVGNLDTKNTKSISFVISEETNYETY